MNRTIQREDPQVGFRWGESEGTYYLEHPDGDGFRRLSDDALTLLRGFASGEIEEADLDRNEDAKDLVERLRRDGYLDPDAPVVRIEQPSDIRLWPRVVAFVLLVGFSLYVGWLESGAFQRYDALFTPARLTALSALTVFALAVHESGHYVSARRFLDPSVRLGAVNAVLPAVITDTTGAWTLPRNRRLWITLAGPFVELCLLVGVVAVHYLLFPDSLVLSALVLSIVGHIVFSLNPLVHGDGYWLIVDALGAVNFRKQGFSDLEERIPSLAAGYVLVSYAYGIATVVVSIAFTYLFFGPVALVVSTGGLAVVLVKKTHLQALADRVQS